MEPIVMPSARRDLRNPVAARSGRHNESQAGCNNEPNRSQRTNQDFDTEAKNQPIFSQAFGMSLTSGRAKRQALSTPSTGELTRGQLAGTYP
jgi:hypothetical protein